MATAKKLCFLVGCQRSGTTWLQRILQQHPDICGAEESHFFRLFGPSLRQAQEMIARDRKTGPLVYSDLESFEECLRSLWNDIFSRLYADFANCQIHLEKTPDHCLYLAEIIQLFPRARIIILLRDSRACVSSLVNAGRTWGAYWAPKSSKDAAILWHRNMKAVTDWQRTNSNHPCFVVHFEEAIRNPRPTVKNILAFLDLDGHDLTLSQMLNDDGAPTNDPVGFIRKRGPDGWRDDLSWYDKLVTWRYTRKMMWKLGYECHPFG